MASELVLASVVVFLVVFAGLMSGLTLGLMSQDIMDLRVLQMSGSPKEKMYAERISRVVENPHFTLVTLLLCNAIAVEALPLFLDKLVHEVTAILLSVTVVLVFGEIVPQALCCRYGLTIGAHSASFVIFLRRLTFPISWPISKVLDWSIGSSHTMIFKRPELKALVSLHSGLEGLGGVLTDDEVNIILGALDMHTKRVEKAMTPMEKVFMVSEDDVLDRVMLDKIINTGHSRIPVYSKNNQKEILGLILAKELLSVNPQEKKKVGSINLRSVPCLPSNLPMYDVLNLFKTGRSHMAVLTVPAPKATSSSNETGWTEVSGAVDREVVGIVTLEDLIEELLQQEIVDETDVFEDNLRTSMVNRQANTKKLPNHVRKWLQAFTPGGIARRPSFGQNVGLSDIDRTEGPGYVVQLRRISTVEDESAPLLPKKNVI